VKGDADDEMVENISIIGIGTSGELDGIGIKIRRARNIIIQNLKIHHVSIGDKDCISIEGPASNIWVDHCELYNEYDGIGKDYYDGLVDAKAESEYITISWNYLHDSWKASLVGSSDNDSFDRKMTYHHNYFFYSNSRLPSYRHGQGHVFNNYYDTVFTGGVNSRIGARLRIEGNYFKDAHDPICSKDSPQGFWDLGPGTNIDTNVYDNCTWGTTSGNEYTNAYISGFVDTETYDPPYIYTLQSASEARDNVLTDCGVGKIIDPHRSKP
jgi:pectate lyase